jgi:hypothetical protein
MHVPSLVVESMMATAPVPVASPEQLPEVMIAEFAGASNERVGPPKVITESASIRTVAREMRER